MNDKINFAVFASYNGSNIDPIYKASMDNIININISVIITNNTNANVINKAKELNIPCFIINDKNSSDTSVSIKEKLDEYSCTHILLSGYMKKISSLLTNNYTIINTHPALLPSYGGAGMYGSFVHEAVVNNKEEKSGVSVHYVNEKYDDGEIIYQDSLVLDKNETADTLEEKVKALEKIAIVEALKICLK